MGRQCKIWDFDRLQQPFPTMSSISFYCAVCGQALIAEPSFAGEVMECARCRRWVPVPGYPRSRGVSGCAAVYPPEILRIDVVFPCQGCNARLEVDGRLEGRELVCPRCHAAVRAPLWSRSPTTAAADARTPKKAPPALTPEEIEFLSSDDSRLRAG
jgi:DNA-directed RNA polymerase subunit RPC12/RpoP